MRLLTITGVDVTSDYSHATVFFSSLGDQEQIHSCLEGLEHGKGFLRRELARRIGLRVVPELHFSYDASVERGVRLSRLIDAAVASDERWPNADE